jgi:uncharacterized protein YdaU (DUF1376 family)
MANPWFQFYHSDWISGTRRLSPTTRAIYVDILCMIYAASGPIIRDDIGMARECAVTLKTFKKSLSELLQTGKLKQVGEQIFNEKAAKNIEKAEKKSKDSSRAANKRWSDFNQSNQSPPDAVALQTHEVGICVHDASTTTTTTIEERKEEPKKVLPKERRGYRLPDDFEPDASCHAVAEELCFTNRQSQIEFENFKDYWKAMPGAAGLKLDWQATLRRWLRSSKTKGMQNGKYQTNHKPNSMAAGFEIVDAAVDAFLEREAQREGSVSAEYGENNIGALPRLQQSTA